MAVTQVGLVVPAASGSSLGTGIPLLKLRAPASAWLQAGGAVVQVRADVGLEAEGGHRGGGALGNRSQGGAAHLVPDDLRRRVDAAIQAHHVGEEGRVHRAHATSGIPDWPMGRIVHAGARTLDMSRARIKLEHAEGIGKWELASSADGDSLVLHVRTENENENLRIDDLSKLDHLETLQLVHSNILYRNF